MVMVAIPALWAVIEAVEPATEAVAELSSDEDAVYVGASPLKAPDNCSGNTSPTRNS